MMKTAFKVLAFLGFLAMISLLAFYGGRRAQSVMCALIFAGMVTLAATYGILRNNDKQ